MATINARDLHFKTLNEMIKAAGSGDLTIENCIGQRYIAAGLKDIDIVIEGTPGNALGAYLNGANITVLQNAQDATGDTMNEGTIIVNGNSGDGTGYGMRGGKIYVKGDTGYRSGIHMKEYKEKVPLLVIGGKAGSFLGEYQAGGIIVVLGLNSDGQLPVGNFCGTGMHGGKIFIRSDVEPKDLPAQIVASKATPEDKKEIAGYIDEFCKVFLLNKEDIMKQNFYVLLPNSKNPYKQLYTHN